MVISDAAQWLMVVGCWLTALACMRRVRAPRPSLVRFMDIAIGQVFTASGVFDGGATHERRMWKTRVIEDGTNSVCELGERWTLAGHDIVSVPAPLGVAP